MLITVRARLDTHHPETVFLTLNEYLPQDDGQPSKSSHQVRIALALNVVGEWLDEFVEQHSV